MKLSAHTNSIISISVKEQIKILFENDFSSVMLFWYKDRFDTPVDDFPEYARKLGMSIENIHIPFWQEDFLWKQTIEGEASEKYIIKCLEDCKNHGIETAVLHPRGWKSQTPLSQVGVDRYSRIIEVAERNKVNLALENTSDIDAVDFLFNNINSSRLKFCYDNGHDNIFPQDENILLKYQDRLAAIHLTDNDGVDDLHLLPFDGNVDWSKLINNLATINYQGALAFEVGWQYRDEVKRYSHDAYIKELRKRAEKILSLRTD